MQNLKIRKFILKVFYKKIAPTQYKRLKVMHKEVLNLEICRIDVYTFGYEATTCTLYIAKIIITVTIQILSVEHTQWQWKTFEIWGATIHVSV